MYNVEEYIDRCLDSLTKQDCDDYEIIVIDDKSTDHSLELAKRWADKYNFISVVCKDYNSGLSETRNFGLNRAKGDYIIFVDSDDYVEENCFSRILMELANHSFPDIMYFAFYDENTDGDSKYRDMFASPHDLVLQGDSFFLNELKNRQFYNPACMAVFRREIIIQNQVFFKPYLLFEDILWSPQILLKAKRVCHVRFAYYHYVKRPNSISNAKDSTQSGIDILGTSIELFQLANEFEGDLRKWMRNYTAMLYMQATTFGRLYRKQYRKMIDRSFPLRNVCNSFDLAKAIVYMISPNLYGMINITYNNMKNHQKRAPHQINPS